MARDQKLRSIRAFFSNGTYSASTLEKEVRNRLSPPFLSFSGVVDSLAVAVYSFFLL